MEEEMYVENKDEGTQKVIRRRKKQLYSAIRERMEFYFSDANLQRDRFLSQLLKNGNEVDLEVFMKFNKILQLTNNVRDLAKALKKSEMLQLSEDKTKVFRVTPVMEKPNSDACTIYVEQLSCDADHDWLKDVFSKFGKVDYISIPKYKISGKNKGFAFVEFETPEGAQKALEEFEKAGCCLTNQMNPEHLRSIATYEEDKLDSKNQNSQTTDSDKDKGVSRKRKNSEKILPNGDNSGPKEKKPKNINPSYEDNCPESKSSKSPGEEPEKIPDAKQSKEEENVKAPEEEAKVVKKKKNRKKKKSHKSKYNQDIHSYGLQILSKIDWKKLRNKYLNLQKEKMKKLKQHLYKNQNNHSQRQQLINESQSKPRFEFKNGVIVKVVLDEPPDTATKVQQLKCQAKSFANVEYVDVSEEKRVLYIRFSNEKSVQELIQSKTWENMSVLEGAEEQEYWEKMKKDRTEKLENKKKFSNKRGRNKLINKAEKLISKRIRLSVDE